MPPPPKVQPPQKLWFTMNSLRNTAISSPDDSVHYEIVTRFWHPHITKINRCDFENLLVEMVAEIERIPGRESRVRFGGDKGEWISASEFVQFEDGQDGVASFTATSNVKYRWKTKKGRLQLVKDGDDETSVAEFFPHRRHFLVFRMSKHARLEVKPQPEVTEALERLIVSYLLVERRRRDSRPLRIKLEKA